MTEQEWLASEDPSAMLHWLTIAEMEWTAATDAARERSRLASYRKLRLWVEACRDLNGRSADMPFVDIDDVSSLRSLVDFWSGTTPLSYVVKAALLHDIFGNPFRPTLQLCGHHSIADDCQGCRAVRTPTVLSLARAAYEERGRKCEKCKKAKWGFTLSGGVPGCPDCHGTGTIDDGTLDNARLAVLSDALEEAGCDNSDILNHLRQQFVARYRFAGATGHGPSVATRQLAEADAGRLRDHYHCLADVWVECPMHVRGCWVIDLILGKS